MKIAIISDTHDNIPNIEKFLAWAKKNKIEKIIHCGDIASAETVNLLSRNFNGEILIAFGNMDANYRQHISDLSGTWPNVALLDDIGRTIIENINIAFCHFPEQAKELAQSGKYHLVFYGHTHKPWMETLPNNSQLINPGTLGGVFQKACFAVYNTVTKKLELKILETL